MKAFGFDSDPDWFEETIPTPVGETCLHCDDPILEGERGVTMPLIAADRQPRVAVYHWECHLRLIVGSVRHQRGQCGCFTGDFSVDDDADYPSRRAAAIAAAIEFQRRYPGDVAEAPQERQDFE